VTITLLLALTPPILGADGDWPMWRHDPALTGYQPAPGAMAREPRILARHPLGASPGTTTSADLLGSGHDAEVLVLAGARLAAYGAGGERLWERRPQGYVLDHVEWVEDLDGDGRNEVVTLAGHMGGTRQAYLILDGRTGAQRAAIDFITGDFAWKGLCGAYLPGTRGKQIFLVTSMRQAASEAPPELTPPGSPHQARPVANGEFSLWAFDGHKAERRWARTPPEYYVEYPSVLVGDMAGDGRLRAVVDSWCHVWNLDLATGEVASHTTWNPGGANERHYGFTRLTDVDGDGKPDFVNLALTKHIDVLRNDGGRLVHAWTHAWPDTVTTETRSLRWPGEPVVDGDGDGRPEVVAALFDGQADRRWHLMVFGAATGESKGEALDVVPLATLALRGEKGGAVLLCARSRSLQADPPESHEVVSVRGGRFETLWSSPRSRFLLESRAQASGDPAQAAVAADVDGDGRPEFFTTDRGGSGEIQAWGLDAEGEVVAKPGQPPAPTTRPLPPGIPNRQGTVVPYLLAADLDADGRNELLLYDNAAITALKLDGGTLRPVESVPSTEIPIVADLLGDGTPCLLTAGRGKDGNLWVQARGPERQTLWRFVFPDSGACGQYSQRPHYLAVGRFTGRTGLDVFTYSTKPAARTYVLDGRNGKLVWEQTELPDIGRHFQAFGGRAGACDYEGDGADDVLFLNPDYYCIADGRTGKLHVGPVEVAKLVKWWAAYASPAVLRREGQPPLIYLGGAYSARCVISLDGQKGLWREYLPAERWPLQVGGERFVEGLLPPSGVRGWRGVQAEADGTLACFDAATGEVAWRLVLGTAPSGIVSGDVDGDGRPESLLGGQDGVLRAIRDGGDGGEVLWTKVFDGPVGTPLLADLDGDGNVEAVVSVGDGNVYVLGP
jgi:outer membrane protein assembly factor BamB